MKQRARLLSGLVAYGATAAMAVSLTTMAEPTSAKVQAIRSGGAQYTTDGVTWNTVQVGTTLWGGSTVRTDAAGVVDLNLGQNGPALRVTPDTTLGIKTLDAVEGDREVVTTTELELPNGSIHAIARKMGASSKYEIMTPVSTCGVRGTDISSSSPGDLPVENATGYALYTPPTEAQQMQFQVPSGYTFDPALNNRAGAVVKTLPSMKLELEQAVSELMEFVTVGERGQKWMPRPSWMVPVRQGPVLGEDQDPAWDLKPVANPTTPIKP